MEFLEDFQEKDLFLNEDENENKFKIIMKLVVKTNENPHTLFSSLDESVKKFISSWMKKDILVEIKMKCLRKIFDESSMKITKIDDIHENIKVRKTNSSGLKNSNQVNIFSFQNLNFFF